MGPQIYTESRLADLEASANQTQQESTPTVSSASAAIPFYETTICDEITLTAGAGSDWDPLFDSSDATNRIKFKTISAGGELNQAWLGPECFRRYKAAWSCDQPQTVQVSLSGSTYDDTSISGYVQIKFNGVLYEYQIFGDSGLGYTRYVLSLETARENQIVISTQYAPNSTIFLGQLWDGEVSHWKDPTGLNGYVR